MLKQGVPRRYRWACEREGGLDWARVVQECSTIPGFQTALLKNRLTELTEKLPALPELMRAAGVDPDLIESRAPVIEEQYRNLREVCA